MLINSGRTLILKYDGVYNNIKDKVVSLKDGLLEKYKQEIGEDKVYDFTLGNPSVPCPKEVDEFAIEVIKNDKSFVVDTVKEAIEDSYKRLIEPSIEREIRSDLTEIGEEAAISNFGKNLESLLLTPPMKEMVVLAFDPGYVNGCKIAVVDKTGKYLDSTVVKPFIKSYFNDSKFIYIIFSSLIPFFVEKLTKECNFINLIVGFMLLF